MATFDGAPEQVSKTPVFVQPHRFAEPVLGALAELGYTFQDTEVRRTPDRPMPVVQQWQFDSPAGKLGVVLLPDSNGVEPSKADVAVRFPAYDLAGGAGEVAGRLAERLRAHS